MLNLSPVFNRAFNSPSMKTNYWFFWARFFWTGLILMCASWLMGASSASSSLLSDGLAPGQMAVDVLPGNPDNIVDLKQVRIIVIAILGSDTLNITDINPRTIRFEATTQTLVGKTDKSLCRTDDINGDGYVDLVCDVKTIGFRVEAGDIPVTISAGTYQRESLRAEGMLRYVPAQ
jgi:hypothetical protein